MKNRKIQSHDSLILTKSETRGQKHTQPRKRITENPFLNRNVDILKKTIFTKPTAYSGNADILFKQSLRNYDDFEITKAYKWAHKFLSSNKSLESLKPFRKPSAPKFGEGDSKSTRKRTSQKTRPQEGRYLGRKSSHSHHSLKKGREIFLTAKSKFEFKKQPEELEHEEFYSPIGQPEPEESTKSDTHLLSISQEEHSTEESTVVEENDLFIMADDELAAAEDLMERVEMELDEVISEAQEDGSEYGDDVPETSEQDATETSEADGSEPEEAPAAPEGAENTSGVEGPESTATESEAAPSSEVEAGAGETSEVTESTTDAAVRKDGGDAEPAVPFDSNIDSGLLQELEEAEKQAMETAKIIYDLKERVAELLAKATMTQSESKELEQKNKLLSEQMNIFEAKTKRIQSLIQKANMFDSMISPKKQDEYKEDGLPKVIICGVTENNMPKIIVCDDKKKRSSMTDGGSFTMPPPVAVMPQFAKRLSESYSMQEKLAAENADLEGKRYKLQEDLLNKDYTVESLQRKLQSIQGELRMVCKENCLLTEKLQRIESCPAPCSKLDSDEYSDLDAPCKKHLKKKKMPCGKGKAPCPAEVEERLQGYSETTQQLEKQLCEMENQVRSMQSELESVQKERQHLEQHRRMLCQQSLPCPPSPPCPPPTCAPPPPCAPSPCAPPPCAKPPCPGPCNPNARAGSDQQLRELREQYNRLQDDYKSKLTEVAGLRADAEKLRQTAKDADDSKKELEDKVKEYEKELRNYRTDKDKLVGSKEQLIEQEQQLSVAKQRFREAQDELEELRALIQDQQAQLDDYRNKYLQAQQQVEEQRRQIDMMEMENNRISEQVNLEIQRVKNQFQEKLQELTPLPDILKATQIKLQEAQQMHLLAERNNEAMVRELQAYRDKAAAMADQMQRVRSDQQVGADEKATLEQRAQEMERKCDELLEDNDRLKTELAKMEEIAEQNEKRVQEKLHEIAQLVSQLETVREESARQVARTKDRCETVRRSMQNQIADLERQLAQSRAQARSAQKDRDDIRQKMQSQINNLNENFEDAKMRIRNLQGHVNFLKTSYTNVFPNDMVSDPMDACDCGNLY